MQISGLGIVHLDDHGHNQCLLVAGRRPLQTDPKATFIQQPQSDLSLLKSMLTSSMKVSLVATLSTYV
jgi:hypothetical protein